MVYYCAGNIFPTVVAEMPTNENNSQMVGAAWIEPYEFIVYDSVSSGPY